MGSNRLVGKVAVVTGGGSGIGRACSLALAANGASVAIGDLLPETAAATAAEIVANGGVAWSGDLDISNSKSTATFVNTALTQFGQIDILINNAGLIVSETTVLDCNEDDWDKTFAINVRGTYLMSRAVLPGMIKRRKGSIVNLGSAAGLAARKRMAAYSASKGAIISLTRAMAADHGLDGIRVNCICPGPTMTPAFKQYLEAAANPEELRRRRESEQMLGRLGEPDDIAQAAVFLASDEAAWITGTAMPVDGGSTA